MAPTRDGIVFIAEDVGDAPDPGFLFTGHWESLEPPRLLESGPGWASADAAIEWGRARADIVLIRIGMPGRYYSAGQRQPRGEPLPEWPPAGAASTGRFPRR
jgi:hypothetical protein